MRNNDSPRGWWPFVDGSISVSASMLLATLIRGCEWCGGLPLLSVLKRLSEQEDGVIIVATLLLFPTTLAVYGGLKVYFAAKEAVEGKVLRRGREEGRTEGRAEGRKEGRVEGREEERRRVLDVLAQQGVPPDSELARRLAGEDI